MKPKGDQDSLDHAVLENTPVLWSEYLPRMDRDIHKYLRGHCMVASGPELETGASRLSALAALNNGAGAVTLIGDRHALRIHAAHVTAIMLREVAALEDFAEILDRERVAALVIGPANGVGASTLARVQLARESAIPLVVDADALTSLVGHLGRFRSAATELSHCILTPHAGEFARLFAPLLMTDPSYVALPEFARISKAEQARAAARLSQSVIVFKGANTIISAPDGRAVVNTNAGPELASAGSGDVLAGLIGAHLAGGMPAFEAAAAAVWQHGFLGARMGLGLTADRLVAQVYPLRSLL